MIAAQYTCDRPCPYIRDPICAKNGRGLKLFGNNCFLENHNRCQQEG